MKPKIYSVLFLQESPLLWVPALSSTLTAKNVHLTPGGFASFINKKRKAKSKGCFCCSGVNTTGWWFPRQVAVRMTRQHEWCAAAGTTGSSCSVMCRSVPCCGYGLGPITPRRSPEFSRPTPCSVHKVRFTSVIDTVIWAWLLPPPCMCTSGRSCKACSMKVNTM